MPDLYSLSIPWQHDLCFSLSFPFYPSLTFFLRESRKGFPFLNCWIYLWKSALNSLVQLSRMPHSSNLHFSKPPFLSVTKKHALSGSCISSLLACHICWRLQRHTQSHSYHGMCFPVPRVTGPLGHLQSVCFLTVMELKSLILPENVFMCLVKKLVIPFCFPSLWCVFVCVCVCTKRTMPGNKPKDILLHTHQASL